MRFISSSIFTMRAAAKISGLWFALIAAGFAQIASAADRPESFADLAERLSPSAPWPLEPVHAFQVSHIRDP